MKVPRPRGPWSDRVAHALTTGEDFAPPTEPLPDAVLRDADAQVALWTLFQLHYRGFEDVIGDREWDPELLRVRGELEARMEAELRTATREAVDSVAGAGDLADALFAFLAEDDAPSLAAHVHRHATPDQVLDFLRERSIYALQESDAHSFVLGRLDGPVKAALAEVQYDEYGSGRPERVHSTLYAEALDAAGLSREYGAYIDQVSAATLAVNTLHSLFGFRYRLRGAAMGHLAAFEATSSIPSRKIAMGIDRVGLPEATAAYFSEHVEADAVHEQVAMRDICEVLVAQDPSLREDVVFGVASCVYLDGLAAVDMLTRWGVDASAGGSAA